MTNLFEKKVISGQDIINAGKQQGKWFKHALAEGNAMLDAGKSYDEAFKHTLSFAPPPVIYLDAYNSKPLYSNIKADNALEEENIDAVTATMNELLRTPVVTAGAIMPDACPTGGKGTIPVGGVVASTDIHPGMHSADICCSMAISIFGDIAPKVLLDAVHEITHFGGGGRARGQQIRPSDDILEAFASNPFLNNNVSLAIEHFATQGDGNHFAYVGTLKSTGETALVTHHGSRAPGARLYDRGMKLAEHYRKDLSPQTLPQNAWIPADSFDGENYWAALQAIRAWTKGNHFAIHDLAAERLGAKIKDRFWNEHNFVFRRSDGLFYHAKGATPAFNNWAEDATGLTLVPMNMAEPIMILRGHDAAHGLGFAPHGAGRNFSRSAHKRLHAGKTDADIFAEETANIDARFFSGVIDISELPSAYKNAATVRDQIQEYGLGEIVDEVLPYGSIMAGDWQVNAPWRQKRARREAEKAMT